jgi:NodT family efflux transporter outer membrane factor (OMF) lipoprotein
LPIEPPPAFSNSGTAAVPDEWWIAFEDRQLNALIDTALANNFNLKTAWQRLLAARAVVDRSSSLLVPDLDAGLQGGASFPQPDFVGGENVRLGLGSQYEVDLWGRIRSGVDAERYRAEASLADYRAGALSLSAEIVLAWYQLTEARGQVELVQDQVETNEQILRLIRARFGSGQVRSVDILRQQQLVEAGREQQVVAESRAEVIEHQLAVLLGQLPQEAPGAVRDSLPTLPPLPETGIPLNLIQRRPDVQATFYQLQAADRDLASAISNKYPRLSLSASLQLRANELDRVFENWAWSIAGNLLAPILYGGELRAEADRNEAVKNQRLYEYGQAVLTAFREVEDALIQEQKQRERIQALEEQLRLIRQTNDQLRTGYFNGAANYLDVLTALGQEQQLRRDILSANLTLLEFRIELYRALAGGFDTGREG